MDNTPYPGSERDNNEALQNCEVHSTATSREIDFVDHWINFTVEQEVLRGSKLRAEKLKGHPQPDPCGVVNIDFIKSPCVDYSSRKYRKCHTRSSPRATSINNSRPDSPCWGYSQQIVLSRPHTPTSKQKYTERCPMRIAELAVPTKRQCIDTWRNKCSVLPSCMVERLRQHVMDETPVVQITDAINCFQRRRPKSTKSVKSAKSKTTKRPRLNRDKQKEQMMEELRKLCAIFGSKIAQKLITPQNLKLNPELNKISRIVAAEIANIMQTKKIDYNDIKNDKIRGEISEKIAVWIATVLEDTSYKLLEEDLRVKKQAERQVEEDLVLTLIGNFSEQDKTDLEDEEGPVLDFIDNLFENVMYICEPNAGDGSDHYSYSEKSSKGSVELYDKSIVSPDSLENNEFDTFNLYNNITYDAGDVTLKEASITSKEVEFTVDDHIQKEIDKIIDHVVIENLSESDYIQYEIHKVIDSIVDDKNENKDTTAEIELNDNNVMLEETKNTDHMVTKPELLQKSELESINMSHSIPFEDVTLDSYSNTENEMDELNKLESPKPENDNVSDVFKIFAEESTDESNKKVQFSQVDIGVQGNLDQLIADDGTKQKLEDEIEKATQLPAKFSHESHNKNLQFAPPNEHLLSQADESWPEDITSPVVKPSASVSRSITSLGKILENEEKMTIATEDNLNVMPKTDKAHIDEKDTLHGKQTSTETQEISKLESQSIQELYHESPTEGIKEIHPIDDTVDSQTFLESEGPQKYELNQDISPKTEAGQLNVQESTANPDLSTADKEIIIPGLGKPESGTNVILAAVQQKMHAHYTLPEPKFDYKVHPNSLPAWLQHEHGKGEPSEDSLYKGKLSDNEIRKWCKDLDGMYANLELWNSWIQATCKSVLQLQQKREMKKMYAPHAGKKDGRDRLSLKKNIDKDAMLWTNLKQRAFKRLKRYNEKSKQNEAIPLHLSPNKKTNAGKPQKQKLGEVADNEDYQNSIKRVKVQDIVEPMLMVSSTTQRKENCRRSLQIVSTQYCMLCKCRNKHNSKGKL